MWRLASQYFIISASLKSLNSSNELAAEKLLSTQAQLRFGSAVKLLHDWFIIKPACSSAALHSSGKEGTLQLSYVMRTSSIRWRSCWRSSLTCVAGSGLRGHLWCVFILNQTGPLSKWQVHGFTVASSRYFCGLAHLLETDLAQGGWFTHDSSQGAQTCTQTRQNNKKREQKGRSSVHNSYQTRSGSAQPHMTEQLFPFIAAIWECIREAGWYGLKI